MPTPSTPRLPLWIFFVTDVVLLGTAWLIASRTAGPLSPTAVFAVVACVIVGAIVGTVPLVIHYERQKNEALDDRQRALEALALTISTAAEQISIAASGLHEIAELAQKNLRQAEQLPPRLQEKITEFQALLTNAQEDEREELKKEVARLRVSESDRLEATADKVDHAVTELAKLEVAAQKHLAAAQAAFSHASEALATATTAAVANIETRLSVRAASVAPMPVVAKGAAVEAPEPAVHIEPVVPHSAAPFESQFVPAGTPPPAESPVTGVVVSTDEPKPARKRAPKKPKPVDPAESGLSLGIDPPAAAPAGAFSQVAPDEPAGTVAEVVERVISSDGATRLLVTAYIGIGNRLFVRGDGPGLRWDKGVPLQFVSIGKWRWETAEATAPVTFKLYKNDEVECTALGRQSLDPGHQQEITATF
jgi:Na+-transporting NADH:ubiquinone oxidoreductase subunit NqrC